MSAGEARPTRAPVKLTATAHGGMAFGAAKRPNTGENVRHLTGRAQGAETPRSKNMRGDSRQLHAQAQVLAGHWCGVPCRRPSARRHGPVGEHLQLQRQSHEDGPDVFPGPHWAQKRAPGSGARGPDFSRLPVLALQPGVHVERDSLDLEVLEIGRVRVDAEELTKEDAYDLLVHVPLNQLH